MTATFSHPMLLAEHVIRYTNEQPVPVAKIIESLEGLQSIATGYLPRAIRELTGAEVVDVRLYVEGFDEGSLIEKTLLCLAFKDEASYELFLGKIRSAVIERFNGSPKVVKGLAVSALIMALVAGGVLLLQPEDGVAGGAGNHITGDNNVIIQIGAEAYNMDPSAFANVIAEVTSKDSRRLANNAGKVLAPARAEPGAGISIEGLDGEFIQVLSPGTIENTPESLKVEVQEFDVRYRDVNLQIRATDRDSTEHGWAAVIPGVVDRRVRLVLDEGVSAEALADHIAVRADVTITSKAVGQGLPKPVVITVHEIIEERE